jgi:hypothetical protein
MASPESAETDSETERNRTPAEQRGVQDVAETYGEEWAEEHAELILAQARLVGEL